MQSVPREVQLLRAKYKVHCLGTLSQYSIQPWMQGLAHNLMNLIAAQPAAMVRFAFDGSISKVGQTYYYSQSWPLFHSVGAFFRESAKFSLFPVDSLVCVRG